MAVIQYIIAALCQHDFAALAYPHIVSVVYFVMFATRFLENGLLPASFLPGDSLLILAGALIAQGVMDCLLENGLLPASFLPGDSLLILAGALIAQGVMDCLPTISFLTAAATLGCGLSYIQGRWLGNTKTV